MCVRVRAHSPPPHTLWFGDMTWTHTGKNPEEAESVLDREVVMTVIRRRRRKVPSFTEASGGIPGP